MTSINDVWAAYEEATGQWTGCNWPAHFGSLGLDSDGVSSSQAQCTGDRWRAIAAGKVVYDEITTGEEATLVDMALHQRLRSAVVCLSDLGEDQSFHLEVCGHPARRFCAEILAREWEFVAYWLEAIEADARWAEEEAKEAVRAAEDGDWNHALQHAHQACLLESGYNAPRPWRRLQRMIEKAAR
jgi:hypothetical protein